MPHLCSRHPRRQKLVSAVLAVVAIVAGWSIPTSHAQGGAVISSEEAANAVLARARAGMRAVGLTLPRDIPLKFRTRDELNTENNANGGRTNELDGFYRPYNPEEIWLVSGLSVPRTLGVLAHELTHAWQSENAPQQDRKLQEGFATWVQYHVLLNEGYASEAAVLTRYGDDDYRGGLLALLALERERQMSGVVEFARTASRL
ncbi:MAG: hypothetical protein EB084_16215 [Proteobacteria bacterium]|nr:hypothetical protein [Pseudomonadota bacterium]